MFVEAADLTRLRQGDILEGVPFPRLGADDVAVLGRINPTRPQPATPSLITNTQTHRDDPHWLTVQIPARMSLCVIASQCCDLEPRNGRITMPTFLAARLIPPPKAIASDPQRLGSLQENKDPRNTRDPGYINFFFLPAHEMLYSESWVVDFNQIVAIPGKEFPSVLSRKVLQMTDVARVKFKIKLATSLARITDEERDSGLENPWNISPQT